ncbi:hypothetical protein ACFPYN_13925 [Paenisporosarcina macmurdoensis]|uniref:Phage portal protein n=1 Tax=Paenisporosarcina macmurdoensis TaxID=212659 RepID=A0ABW1LBZ2_9BACL
MKRDLLLATLNYGIEQVEMSDISIMDFGEEQPAANLLSLDEQLQSLKEMRDTFVSSTTAKLLLLITDCTLNKEAMQNAAPNLIQELAYELLLKENIDEKSADSISDAVFVLTSRLVAEAGFYK